MAKIIIEITQPKDHCGVYVFNNAIGTSLNLELNVETEAHEKLASAVANKVADVLELTISEGIKAAVDSVLKESIKDQSC
ncbi:hypothetical protein V8046_003742 [Vibrio parahaemolyticus]|uniref:hypothetical protein n=1 Tax=Vibrio diabolicus TaxID=50719 RepID=UPI001D654BBD|nr:hypothetical protein [Vibrio parahaemolyticus]EIV8636007.1 hypothetical protein [Vibrio parahaemolyticus]EIZ1449512.1 hypothetical protein [Vibrio parahaemolyticus]EJF4459619.1 hypothetical protein [Vibrio parahaemolyticus]EKB1972505.1 hypothetical protein [Vibrio parahaemolyticus]